MTGLVAMTACSSGDGDAPPTTSGATAPTGSSSTAGAPLHLVVLGDSIALTETCSGCTSFADQVGTAMTDTLGTDVEVSNLAVPGAMVSDTVDLVTEDRTVRDELAAADAVIVTVGFNDVAFGRIDDPCGVEADFPRIEWNDITHECIDAATDEYGADLDTVLSTINELRAGAPTMVRVTTVYNSVLGDEVDPGWNSPDAVEPSIYTTTHMAKVQCEVAEAHDAMCVDTLHALNGEDAADSAQPFLGDATHLAQEGHDAFAQAIVDAGFAPLG